MSFKVATDIMSLFDIFQVALWFYLIPFVAPGHIIAKTIFGDTFFTILLYMLFKSPAYKGDKAH